MKYPSNVLSAFEAGAMQDLRFRLAVHFLQSPLYQGLGDGHASTLAIHALDLAQKLFEEGEARGWVTTMPESTELAAPLKAHIKRGARANLHQQKAAEEIVKESQPRVALVPPGTNVNDFPGVPRQ